MPEQAQQVLSQAQVNQALAVLREERGSHPYTDGQRKLFNWFRISFWGLWLPYIALMALMLTGTVSSSGDESPAVITLMAVMGLSFLSLLFSVPAQWPLFWRTLREFRLARRTRVWQLVGSGKGLWAWVALVGRWAALVIFAVAVVAAGVLIVEEPFPGIAVLFLVLTALFYWFVSYARKRLAALAALEPLLEQGEPARAGSGGVLLPTAVVQQMGDVEDGRIQRRRAEAISKGIAAESGYAVLRSRMLVAEEARLDTATQLQIEARVAGLAADPEPSDAKPAGPGVWRIPAAGVEILYAVDHDARRIELHAIRSTLAESAGGGAASIEHA